MTNTKIAEMMRFYAQKIAQGNQMASPAREIFFTGLAEALLEGATELDLQESIAEFNRYQSEVVSRLQERISGSEVL